MTDRLTRKRVAILSDSRRLARAVELNLRSYPDIECVRLGSGSQSSQRFDLVVLAVGLLTTDPIDLLAETLPDRGRDVPLLLISNEPSRTDWSGEIYCLDFPFNADEFHKQVKEILSLKAQHNCSIVEERV